MYNTSIKATVNNRFLVFNHAACHRALLLSLGNNILKTALILLAIALVLVVSFIGYLAVGFYAVSGYNDYPPVVQDKFFFHRTGEVREYTFRPKIFKDYAVSIKSSRPFPLKEEFRWTVKYQILKNKKLINEGYLREQTRIYNDKKDLSTVKALNFASFGILRYMPGPITLRLFVEKGDPTSEKYINDFMISVDISGYI